MDPASSEDDQSDLPCSICDAGILPNFHARDKEIEKLSGGPIASNLEGEPLKAHEWLFHSSTSCSTASSCHKKAERLCHFCNHLRPRHIFECLWRLQLRFSVELGTLNRLKKRRQCQLCSFILRVAEARLGVFMHGEGRRIYTAHIEFNHSHKASSPIELFFIDLRADRGPKVRVTAFLPSSGESTRGIEASKEYVPSLAKISVGLEVPEMISSLVNWSKVKSWLDGCDSMHPQCRSDGEFELPSEFRLIDVHRRKIILAQPGCRFVALSYVWGAKTVGLQALSGNIEQLQQDGQLANLPTTIEDALQVCLNLGEDLLWVDQLCIVQDDKKNKMRQIEGMAGIYASAAFVIVAASATSMYSPLPGVTVNRQPPGYIQEIVGDFYLTTIMEPLLSDATRWSKWYSRGWTYQEAVLGRRKLFLTNQEAGFECQEEYLHEEHEHSLLQGIIELGPKPFISPLHHTRKWSTEKGHIWDDYREHVMEYTSRELSHVEDMYNAFSAIGDALYGRSGGLFFGLPRLDFDLSLLWFREGGCPDELSINNLGPTWSWGSARGAIAYDTFNMTMDREQFTAWCGPLIVWFEFCQTGGKLDLRAIKSDGEPLFWSSIPDPRSWRTGGNLNSQLYLAIAWNKQCFPAASPLETDGSFTDMRDKFGLRWPQYEVFLDQAFGHIRESDKALSAKDVLQLSQLDPDELSRAGVIVTKAETAHFRIEYPWKNRHNYSSSPDLYNFYIIDEHGERIGFSWAVKPQELPGSPSDKESGNSWEFLPLSLAASTHIPYEKLTGHLWRTFVDDSLTERVIETGNGPDYEEIASEVLQHTQLDITYYDNEGIPLNPVPIVNVMIINWRDGIAYRVAIGWILLTKWAKAKRQNKLIPLG
ncbi:HET-domain-containing protein [Hyaloscypha variabilis F]|uniref:HET-domain-containing protein n=1 Tax=Hyaloscypha variabilis (strain UAMH 11265 / GT02V1 / F) TaxID=1149755 RepID=A0A2J6QZ66_HYAVF|nr:HET-domain-containing protein [Hyaloscypha variabilis F]